MSTLTNLIYLTKCYYSIKDVSYYSYHNCMTAACYVVLLLLVNQRVADCYGCNKISSCVWHCETPKGGGTVDLTNIGQKDGTSKYPDMKTTNPTEDPYLYSYNPCYPFSEGPSGDKDSNCQPINGVVVCQIIGLGSQQTQYINGGTQVSEKFIVIGDNVVVNYTGDGQRVSLVTLVCGDSPNLLVIGETNSNGIYRFTLTTPAVCDLVSGLSPGSVLCIIFFLGLITYFLAGFLVLRFIKKEEGLDAIPNKTFWVTLPGLIKDGTRYSVTAPCAKFHGYEDKS